MTNRRISGVVDCMQGGATELRRAFYIVSRRGCGFATTIYLYPDPQLASSKVAMTDEGFKVPSASLGRKRLEGTEHMPAVEDEPPEVIDFDC